jgi:hypothetical protein
MRNVMKILGSRSVVIIFILLLGAWPVGATVSGDIAAGVPLNRVIANGLGAGLTIEAIIYQALDAGAAYCPLLKAALAQQVDIIRIFKVFMDKCSADPKLSKVCTTCNLMKCALEAGRDVVEVANAIMAAGGDLLQVRRCLASLGYPGAATYAYSPPEPPGPPAGVGPSFPGGSGGGGGGGVASPSS